MQVIKIENLTAGGHYIARDVKEATEFLGADLDDAFDAINAGPTEYKVSIINMSEEELEALPEFDGW